MKKLRVAIIGCGRISVSYLDAFEKLKDEIEVVAAVDLCPDRAHAFAVHFPGCQALTSLDEIYPLRVDVLHVALPHDLHAPISIQALEHGINVLTEKPMALTSADADRMIATAKETKLKFGCIFQTRYNESVMTLKKMALAGDFGTLVSARSYLSWNRPKAYYEKSDWKGSWAHEGGGVLIDQAIHSVDRVRYLAGSDVDYVEGSLHNHAHPYLQVEDTVEACVHFKNGLLYNLFACDYNGADSPINIEFVGTKGSFGLIQDLGYSQINGIRQEYREVEPGEAVGPSYWGTTHVMQLRDFYHSVRDNLPVAISGEEGRKTLELVKGIYLSGLAHKRIVFPFEDKAIPADTDVRKL
jgi:UDP-N-acetyl-2-amino-2-deoxyglucuronate dehydrogenase